MEAALNSGRRNRTGGKKIWLATGLIALVGLFVLFVMSPMRLDDLTWGSEIGLQRLKNGFAGYNGRYASNLIVLGLLRLPAVLRALVQLAVMAGLVFSLRKILGGHSIACGIVIMLSLLLPLEIFTQTVTWVSGFSNYMFSALTVFFILAMELDIVERRVNPAPGWQALFYVTVFLGQMMLETATIYVCALSFALSVLYAFRYKKVSLALGIAFLLAVAGGVIMFSNGAYSAAVAGDASTTYKEIAVSKDFASMIGDYWNIFVTNIVPRWMGENSVINLLLTVLLVLLWNRRGQGRKICPVMQGIGVAFLALFFYDVIDAQWEQMFTIGNTIWAVGTIAFAIYLIATICLTVPGREKCPLLVVAFSQPILIGPLLVANPISARCFFHPWLFWVLLIGLLIRCLCETTEERAPVVEGLANNIGGITCGFVLVMLLVIIGGQSRSWQVEAMRRQEIARCLETGGKSIELPEVPWSAEYCYGANLFNDNEYWITNYKRYFGIPDDVKVTFVSYLGWMKEKQKTTS